MWKAIGEQLNPRRSIYYALSTVLFLSLACSMSMQHGHADVPIAESAELAQPLQGWCPFCNMHLSELKDVVGEIDALGVDVLFLSGDRPELLYKSLSRETQEDIADLDYQILSDADAQAAIAFGIAFKASARTIDRRNEKGQDIVDSSMLKHGVLPVPSVFAIDRNGVIAFSYSNPDYKVRLPADELLQVATEIAASK